MESDAEAGPRMMGTVMKRNNGRVYIRQDGQPVDTIDKNLWFISSKRFRIDADGIKVKPGDRVSFLAADVPKKPNPVANDALIVTDEAEVFQPLQDLGETPIDFWRRCPICPGVVAESVSAWEDHLAGETHANSLRSRSAPQGSGGLAGAGPTQSRFSFAQQQEQEQEQQRAAASIISSEDSNVPADTKKAEEPSAQQSASSILVPRHSPDEPVKLTVTYKNNFVMEYHWPDMTIPTAVLRKAHQPDVIRRQWIVQRLEVVMGEMDEQLPRTAFQNSALDWRDSFLTRLEMHTGERWTWKKIDGELCLGEGKSSATFWRALRVGIQSFAHATHPNILVVKPANATQKMLFGKCHPTELPRSWEIPTHGKFIRLSFVRPELVFAHHQRLNNTTGTDDMMREVTITTEVDVPSLMPMWRLDWRSLMAMPEPIFPGAIHVVGTVAEAPKAIEKLVASCAPDGLIGLWGEWSGDTKGHEYNRLQVIQLATERCSVVFKVGLWKSLPPAALELFTHRTLRTVALGGQEITKKLRKDFKVDVTNGIDVLDLPAAQRCQPRSLKGLVGVFMGWNVGMSQAQSPWDAPRLSPGQLTHAATRPWLVLILYRRILTVIYDSHLGVVEGTLAAKPAVLGAN